MVTRGLTMLAWLMMLLAVAFARLPNNKGGDWGKDILESIRKKIRQIRGLPISQTELSQFDHAIPPSKMRIVEEKDEEKKQIEE